ncbi:crotonase/enoyl-CoA hydratase family protein [Tropicimonas sp.]|uniref:crotonase/enoyl-CoA hydratase family protein n=1 Tax=Tropicimonas sp. TaxID=2067044 RepID=UPI003A8BB80F
MTNLVRVENPDGPVAEVWLNRPDKKNALTLDMLDSLIDAGRNLATCPGLRAVVLCGEGGNFSSGVDTGVLAGLAGRADTVRDEILNPPAGEIANRYQLPAMIWQSLTVPVIAAINGVCFGGGAQIALAADFRIIHPRARFSIMEGRWGLIPDMGISQSLPRLLRADIAKDLIMTARILTGADAYRFGLATRISDDPVDESRRFADALTRRSAEAVGAAKTLVDNIYARDAAADLRLEAELQSTLIGSPGQIGAMRGNPENRAPIFP